MAIKKTYVSYQYCKRLVQSAGIKTKAEYRKRYKELASKGIPSDPTLVYPDKWQGWKNFLGTSKSARSIKSRLHEPAQTQLNLFDDYISYDMLKQMCIENGIKTYNAFIAFIFGAMLSGVKIPDNVEEYYKSKGTWVSFDDLFGIHKNLQQPEYSEAKTWNPSTKTITTEMVKRPAARLCSDSSNQSSKRSKNNGMTHDDAQKLISVFEECLSLLRSMI